MGDNDDDELLFGDGGIKIEAEMEDDSYGSLNNPANFY